MINYDWQCYSCGVLFYSPYFLKYCPVCGSVYKLYSSNKDKMTVIKGRSRKKLKK